MHSTNTLSIHITQPSFPNALYHATERFNFAVSPNTPASVRVRAADSIFNHAAKAVEIEDLDARVTALEQTAPPCSKKR